jgi:hypothetical protein
MKKLTSNQKMHIAIDPDFYEVTEEALSEALTSIREAIAMRKKKPNLDRDATLDLVLQTSRHVAEAASWLPPVDEDGEPYGYESWRNVLNQSKVFAGLCQTNKPAFFFAAIHPRIVRFYKFLRYRRNAKLAVREYCVDSAFDRNNSSTFKSSTLCLVTFVGPMARRPAPFTALRRVWPSFSPARVLPRFD